MQHSAFGGSTAARTMNCAGWRQLADTLPKGDSSSSYADRGTLLHNAMERILGDEDAVPESVIGMEYKDQELTPELFRDKITPALEATRAIFKKYDIKEWACEELVGFTEDSWGTGDVLGGGPAWALVLDFKFGDGIMVSPVENDQFLFYGSAAYHTEATEDLFEEVDNVVFAVVQPSDHRGDDYEVWETTTARLRNYRKPWLKAVKAAKADDPETCAGDWCKFCPGASICPQKTGAAQQAKLMDPKLLKTLRKSLKLADELDDWCAAVRETAHNQLENGAEIKGWKLVMKQARRKWLDPEVVVKKIARKLGGSRAIHNQVLMSPAEIEKLAKSKKIVLPLDDLVSKVSSGTTLAKASDKRHAVLGLAAAQAALASIN
jgi:hypothetical protein